MRSIPPPVPCRKPSRRASTAMGSQCSAPHTRATPAAQTGASSPPFPALGALFPASRWRSRCPARTWGSTASPRATSSSPFRRGSSKSCPRCDNRSRTMPPPTSMWNGRSPDERDELLQRRSPARRGPLELGAGLVEPLQLLALLGVVEERVDQGIAGDGFEHPVAEAVIAHGPEIFIGEVDAG